MEAIAQAEVMPEKKSYLGRFNDFLRRKKLGIAGIAAFSLMGTGCIAGNLEARTYDYYRYNRYSANQGQLVELVCETVRADYDEDNYLDPVLQVVDGEQEGLLVKLSERERPSNQYDLSRARNIINRGDKLVKVFGVVKDTSYDDMITVDPEFLAFSDYDGNLYDTVYTDADTTDIGWMGMYRPYFRALDLWGWGNPFGHGTWSSFHFWGINAFDDWDHDGIPNIMDPNPFGGFWNPYGHFWWRHFHNHHNDHFDPDGHGGYRPKPIVIKKHELEQSDYKGLRVIRKDALTPGKRVIDRIERGEIDGRAIRKIDSNYDNNRIRSNDGRTDNEGAVRRSDGKSQDNNRAVKKKDDTPRTYQPVPPPPPETKDDEKAVEKKKDDGEGRSAFVSRYSGSKDYASSENTATKSLNSTRFKYVPKSTPVDTGSYRAKQSEVKRFNFPDASSYRARTPVYRNDSGARSSSGSSTRSYSAPVVRRDSSSYSGSSRSSGTVSRSYTPSSSARSSSSSSSRSSSSSGTAVKKDKG